MLGRSSGNYAYVVARVKAKKSALLTEEDYDKMLMMSVPEISRYISEAGYGKEMADLGNRMIGLNLLEHATRLNMAKEFSSILRSSTGELYDMVSAYLDKWDVWNLKVILRGKSYGLNADGIREDLVPAGKLSSEDLEKMLVQENVEEILADFGKKTHLTFPPDVIEAYKTTENLGEIEDFLEKAHYERLVKKTSPLSRPSKLFLDYIRDEIDLRNFETILKLKAEGIYGEQVSKYMIPKGRRIDSRMLDILANAEDISSVMSEVSQLEFGETVKEALEAKDFTAAIALLQRYGLNKARKFSRLYPLSVIPVVDYMINKEKEMRNIRTIARGTESGLDRETIKKLLVI